MNSGNSFLLVVVGLVLIYLILSDRFYCLEAGLKCAFGFPVGASGEMKGVA